MAAITFIDEYDLELSPDYIITQESNTPIFLWTLEQKWDSIKERNLAQSLWYKITQGREIHDYDMIEKLLGTKKRSRSLEWCVLHPGMASIPCSILKHVVFWLIPS